MKFISYLTSHKQYTFFRPLEYLTVVCAELVVCGY